MAQAEKQPAIKRHRITKADMAILDAQIIQVLEEDNPQSVRHVFYRMTDPRLTVPVEKTEEGYGKIQRRCLALRRTGEIPYGWISDASRQGYHTHTFSEPGEFIRAYSGIYRGQLWAQAEHYVEVWCESRSIGGVLKGICEELAVSLYPAGGFSSATFCYESAEKIKGQKKDKVIILYVGDYDPAGLHIDLSIEKELREHLTKDRTTMAAHPFLTDEEYEALLEKYWNDESLRDEIHLNEYIINSVFGNEKYLEFHRLAINKTQIAEYNLPTKPRKKPKKGEKGDRRRLDIQQTVEAEAMPASELKRIVRDKVESYLPEGALQAVKIAEESEREGLELLSERISRHGINDFMRQGGF